jgi:cell division protein FtsW (lipid II flippase)
VFLLACAGLLTMYSSGYDHGTRFIDHGRNMLLAGFIMFVVAQVPPQRLMSFAVPLYTWAWRCWSRWRCSASPRRAPSAGSTWAW